ncbi:hypothetical protein DEU56DRAFT_918483 [Suillus clintonianus]|uniref:uncharacterized protein n=1 Tax=Suillus clintonianus TaxID=1904413 RepID=UPI001B875675|nr:uncharacterized protein DEU56DRAFT_918483 [Suillus clintonianus]KAG2120151.1 hypothetical protein DEU56DRAFT_918483 [Suillus clintonianus]
MFYPSPPGSPSEPPPASIAGVKCPAAISARRTGLEVPPPPLPSHYIIARRPSENSRSCCVKPTLLEPALCYILAFTLCHAYARTTHSYLNYGVLCSRCVKPTLELRVLVAFTLCHARRP